MAQPWESPIGKLNQGLLAGMQMAQQKQAMDQKAKSQELDDAIKTLSSVGQLIQQAKKAGASKVYLNELMKSWDGARVRIFDNLGIKGGTYNGNFVDEDVTHAKNFTKLTDAIVNGDIPVSEYSKLANDWISNVMASEEPDTAEKIIKHTKEQTAQGIYGELKQQPNMSGQWLRGRESVLGLLSPEHLAKQYGAEQQASRVGMIGGELAALPEGSDQEPILSKAYVEQGGDPSKLRTMTKNEGISSDTGFLTPEGDMIVRNTRDDKVKVVKLPTGAYKKEGMKEKEEESLVGALKTLPIFKDLEDTIGRVSTGIPKAGEAKVAINRYLSKDDAIKFNAARDQLRNLAQEVIKGIPSNFDVENFIKTLPNADYTLADNKERIRQSRRLLKIGIKSKIENARSRRLPIPQTVSDMAKEFKVFEKEETQRKSLGEIFGK